MDISLLEFLKYEYFKVYFYHFKDLIEATLQNALV